MEPGLAGFVSSFNACGSPKDVLKLVQAAGYSAEDLGSLLYQAEAQVDVDLLGACLGNHADFWKSFTRKYPEHFECFSGMDIVTAIRSYLWRFRLPGEAAQIDRILDGFARAYFRHNASGGLSAAGAARCWEAGARGWYTRQPRSTARDQPCCVHCGALDGQIGDLLACQGCQVVHFCRRCRKLASRQGHAVCGVYGYGRACVAAMREAGTLPGDGGIKIVGHGLPHGATQSVKVSSESMQWERENPFLSQDAIFVLAFAIIMLTTNLHSSQVKNKMMKHEFIQQNREVNAGANFPADLLSDIYGNIRQEEVKVMRQVCQ